MKLTLLLTFAIVSFNTGLIWIVQLVHYPGFLWIGETTYGSYQDFHMRSITWIVAPSMLAELLLSTGLLIFLKALNANGLLIASYLMLLAIWGVTAFWAAPTHGKLLAGFNDELIHSLININWWRTVLWSGRMIILGYLVWKVMR